LKNFFLVLPFLAAQFRLEAFLWRESRLEHVVRSDQSCPPSELSDRLLSEIQHWQPASASQQNDITLIVIDVIDAV
jgi:hypothetical protein